MKDVGLGKQKIADIVKYARAMLDTPGAKHANLSFPCEKQVTLFALFILEMIIPHLH